MDNIGLNSKENIGDNTVHHRSTFINIQNVPVKKSRVKRLMPYIASTVISALIGGIAGGAYVNYELNRKNSYTNMVFPSLDSSGQMRTASYTPSSSLVTRIAEEVGPAIVGIDTKVVTKGIFGDAEIFQGSGSGIIIGSKGYIVTNQHVIDGSSDIRVKLPGAKENIKAQVIGADYRSDLALLKIDADNLPTAVMGDSSRVRVGDLAVAIGNPMGDEYAGSVTCGIVSALNRTADIEGKRYRLIQTDAAINPGNSGGALINEYGEVIGINTIKFLDNRVEGMGFAIPINEAKPIIEQLLKNGYVNWPNLGIDPITITEQMAGEYNMPAGVGIEYVEAGGAAETAGIMAKDILVEIDGVVIKSSEDLLGELDRHKVGDTIKVKLWRDNSYMTVTATLKDSSKNLNK